MRGPARPVGIDARPRDPRPRGVTCTSMVGFCALTAQRTMCAPRHARQDPPSPMQLTTTLPHPTDLRLAPLEPTFDLDRDAIRLDSLPRELEDRVTLPIRSSATWGDDGDRWPIDDWYAAPSHYEQPMRMERAGIRAALAGADQLAARLGMPVAVVEDATAGSRFLLPLGVWNPVDESELTFDDAGGLPRWNGSRDHVLVGRNDAPDGLDVEAVVFRDGDTARWINLTGHPIRTS
jgi:hypothetical protein